MDPFEQGLREAAQNDHNYQSWTPNVGDTLVGRYLGTDTVPTKHGMKQVMKVRDEKTDEVLTVWMNVVLISEFEREAPAMGDRVGITRLEDGKPTRGFPPKRYLMRVDRTAAPMAGRVLRPEPGVQMQPPAQQAPQQQVAQHPMGGPAVTQATMSTYNRLLAHPLLTLEEKAQYQGYTRNPKFTEEKALAGIEKLNELIGSREPPEDDEIPF